MYESGQDSSNLKNFQENAMTSTSAIVSSFLIVSKKGDRTSLFIHADRSCSIRTDVGEIQIEAQISRDVACDILTLNRDNLHICKLRQQPDMSCPF